MRSQVEKIYDVTRGNIHARAHARTLTDHRMHKLQGRPIEVKFGGPNDIAYAFLSFTLLVIVFPLLCTTVEKNRAESFQGNFVAW